MEVEDLFTLKEAAVYLHMSFRGFMDKFVRNGKIEVTAITPRKRYIHKSALKAVLENNTGSYNPDNLEYRAER